MSSKQKTKPSTPVTPSKSPAGRKRKSKAVEQTSKKLKTSEHVTNSKPTASDSKAKSHGDSCIKRDRFGKLVFEDYPEFRPNMTPKQVLQAGSFGGTYFRPIFSKVTGTADFYLGRRTEDDRRQIDRWSRCTGEKGRWKNNLVTKIVRSGCSYDNHSVSPVVRQVLQHWGYQLTKGDFEKRAKIVRQQIASK